MNNFPITRSLITDKEVATMFSMSSSWVRKQRFLRRKGEEHFLTIDPVMIGSNPRYLIEDIETLFSSLKGGL